jgi:putative transposase
VGARNLSRTAAFQLAGEYGAFGVSVSQLDKTIAYIRNQPEHHRRISFQEEFVILLQKHGINFDERYLWE